MCTLRPTAKLALASGGNLGLKGMAYALQVQLHMCYTRCEVVPYQG